MEEIKQEAIETNEVVIEKALTEEELVATFGERPDDAPLIPRSHGLEDAYEVSR